MVAVVIISFFELLQSQNMAETNKEIKHIFDSSLNLHHKKIDSLTKASDKQ